MNHDSDHEDGPDEIFAPGDELVDSEDQEGEPEDDEWFDQMISATLSREGSTLLDELEEETQPEVTKSEEPARPVARPLQTGCPNSQVVVLDDASDQEAEVSAPKPSSQISKAERARLLRQKILELEKSLAETAHPYLN